MSAAARAERHEYPCPVIEQLITSLRPWARWGGAVAAKEDLAEILARFESLARVADPLHTAERAAAVVDAAVRVLAPSRIAGLRIERQPNPEAIATLFASCPEITLWNVSAELERLRAAVDLWRHGYGDSAAAGDAVLALEWINHWDWEIAARVAAWLAVSHGCWARTYEATWSGAEILLSVAVGVTAPPAASCVEDRRGPRSMSEARSDESLRARFHEAHAELETLTPARLYHVETEAREAAASEITAAAGKGCKDLEAAVKALTPERADAILRPHRRRVREHAEHHAQRRRALTLLCLDLAPRCALPGPGAAAWREYAIEGQPISRPRAGDYRSTGSGARYARCWAELHAADAKSAGALDARVLGVMRGQLCGPAAAEPFLGVQPESFVTLVWCTEQDLRLIPFRLALDLEQRARFILRSALNPRVLLPTLTLDALAAIRAGDPGTVQAPLAHNRPQKRREKSTV